MVQVLTGHPKVDAISQIHIEGNVVCNSWRTHLQYENKRGKYTHHLALLLLADIVYWHKATEVRDEDTGSTVGWRKKFKGERLQKTYKALAVQLGASIEQVKDAAKFLQSQGLITLTFETVQRHNDTPLGNVMYVDIDPEKIASISYRERLSESIPPLRVNSSIGVENAPPLRVNSPIGVDEITHSYGSNRPDSTETTTEISTEVNQEKSPLTPLPGEPEEEGGENSLRCNPEEPGRKQKPPLLSKQNTEALLQTKDPVVVKDSAAPPPPTKKPKQQPVISDGATAAASPSAAVKTDVQAAGVNPLTSEAAAVKTGVQAAGDIAAMVVNSMASGSAAMDLYPWQLSSERNDYDPEFVESIRAEHLNLCTRYRENGATTADAQNWIAGRQRDLDKLPEVQARWDTFAARRKAAETPAIAPEPRYRAIPDDYPNFPTVSLSQHEAWVEECLQIGEEVFKAKYPWHGEWIRCISHFSKYRVKLFSRILAARSLAPA